MGSGVARRRRKRRQEEEGGGQGHIILTTFLDARFYLGHFKYIM